MVHARVFDLKGKGGGRQCAYLLYGLDVYRQIIKYLLGIGIG